VPSRRVLLVDGNDDFLDGLASLMAKRPGLEIVGRAHLGFEAVERARSLSPDLVLMDVSLKDMSGFEAVDLIKAHPRAPKVLLMTFHESRAAVSAALASGADGCLSKSSMTERLLSVIEGLVGPTGEEGGEADGTARRNVGRD
jgi:DNA-binding NarL/FixJ family response regulator